MPAHTARGKRRRMYWCGNAGVRSRVKTQDCVFGLQREFFRVAVAVFRSSGLSIPLSGLCPAKDHVARSLDTGAGGDAFQQLVIEHTEFGHHLDIIIGAAIVQCYKLVVAEGAHPSHHRCFVVGVVAGQQVFTRVRLLNI